MAEPPDPVDAFAEADEVTTRWIEAVRAAGGGDRRPMWARRYWKDRDRRAGMPGTDGDVPGPADRSGQPAP